MATTTSVEEVPPPPDLTNFIVKSSDQYSNGGSFGDVYRCWYNCGADAPKEVAVKAFRFRLENTSSSRAHKMIRRELGIWRRLNHKNIVPFLGIAYGFGMQDAISLVSLWMANDTLLKFLEKHDHELNVGHRLQLLLDIANGLDHLHSFPIVHGDLNCNNVLLDANYTARLADFGYASLVGNIPEAFAYLEMSTARPGAMRWAAPEQVFPQAEFKLTTKSDMYSFGCISLQEGLIDIVLSGKKPWSEVEKDSIVVLCVAQGRKPSRPETCEIDDRHWDFIQRCWLSVQERPSATEAITCIQQFLNYYPQSLLIHNLFVPHTAQFDPLVNVAKDPSIALTLVPGGNLNQNGIQGERVDVHLEQEAGVHLQSGGISHQIPALHLEGTVHILDITLYVRDLFGKTVDLIKFQTGGGTLKEIPVSVSPGNAHREVLDDPLRLPVRERLKISMEYRARFGRRATLSIPVALNDVNAQAQGDNNGRKIYVKIYKDIEVTIGIASFSAPSQGSYDAPLPSTTGGILDICPRFRLLILGNSGVGKSTLIRKVFGVKDVDVSESSLGQADIDKEYIAQENGLFVIHHSLGVEAGESDKVKNFIRCRRDMVELKDRLHAVWVCLAVPFAGGRLFEAGMEEFLRRRKEILGDIPIVVVLMKLDLLDGSLLMDIWDTVTGDSEKEKAVLQIRRDVFLEHCINPLLRAAGNDIPWIAVSTAAWLEPTVSALKKTTASEIERHVKAHPSCVAMSDQSSFERDALFHVVRMAFGTNIEEKSS